MPLHTDSRRPARWFHRHPAAALAAIAALGVAVALLGAELLARALAPQWAPVTAERVAFWRYDAALGWAHEPGQRGRFVHPDFRVDVVINSQGLRDDEYPFARSGRRRMLVLGDSFGWGFGVDVAERFSEVIERDNPSWEVINASVSGYGTDQELLYLRETGMRYAPDVVVVVFHENDFENNARSQEYWYSKPYFTLDGGALELHNVPVPPSTLKQRCNRFFYGRTYLLGRIYAFAGRATREWRRPFWSRGEVSPGGDARVELTAALYAEMNRVCVDGGARLVVVSAPMGDPARAVLREACAGAGIPYLPLDDAFRSAGEGLTFPHDGHWTPRGHRVAARSIATFLRDRDVADVDTRG